LKNHDQTYKIHKILYHFFVRSGPIAPIQELFKIIKLLINCITKDRPQLWDRKVVGIYR